MAMLHDDELFGALSGVSLYVRINQAADGSAVVEVALPGNGSTVETMVHASGTTRFEAYRAAWTLVEAELAKYDDEEEAA